MGVTVEAWEKEHGFTLGELMAVILVLGILAAIAIPSFLEWYRAPIKATMKADLVNTATHLRIKWETEGSFPTEIPEEARASRGNSFDYAPDMLLDDPQHIDKNTPTTNFKARHQGNGNSKNYDFGMLAEYAAGSDRLRVAFSDRENDGPRYLRGQPRTSSIYNNFVIYKLSYACLAPGSTAPSHHTEHIGYDDHLHTAVTVQDIETCGDDGEPVPGSYKISGYSDEELKSLIRDTNYGGHAYYIGSTMTLQPKKIEDACLQITNPRVPDVFSYLTQERKVVEGGCNDGPQPWEDTDLDPKDVPGHPDYDPNVKKNALTPPTSTTTPVDPKTVTTPTIEPEPIPTCLNGVKGNGECKK